MSAFPWGRIVQTHRVGPYEIVEYAERGSDNHPTHRNTETGRHLFHVGVHPGCESGESFTTLDRALLGAIANRHDDRRGAHYAAACMGLPETEGTK